MGLNIFRDFFHKGVMAFLDGSLFYHQSFEYLIVQTNLYIYINSKLSNNIRCRTSEPGRNLFSWGVAC